jgi:hypothetical protein
MCDFLFLCIFIGWSSKETNKHEYKQLNKHTSIHACMQASKRKCPQRLKFNLTQPTNKAELLHLNSKKRAKSAGCGIRTHAAQRTTDLAGLPPTRLGQPRLRSTKTLSHYGCHIFIVCLYQSLRSPQGQVHRIETDFRRLSVNNLFYS